MHFSTFFYSFFLLKVGEYSFEEYFDGGKGETLPTSLPLFWKIFQPFPLSWGNTTLEPFEGKFGEREKEGRGKGTSSLWNDATPLSLNFPQVRMVVVQVCVVLRVGKKIPLGILLHTHSSTQLAHKSFSHQKKKGMGESLHFFIIQKRGIFSFLFKNVVFFSFPFWIGFYQCVSFWRNYKKSVVSPESDAEIVKNSSRETKQTSHVRKQDCILKTKQNPFLFSSFHLSFLLFQRERKNREREREKKIWIGYVVWKWNFSTTPSTQALLTLTKKKKLFFWMWSSSGWSCQ